MKYPSLIFFALSFLWTGPIIAQHNIVDVLNQVETNNKAIKSNANYAEARRMAARTGLNPYDPEVEYDHLFGSPAGAGNQRDLSVTQRLDFPTTYRKKRELSRSTITMTTLEEKVFRQNVKLEAKLLFLHLVYLNKRDAELGRRLSGFQKLVADYEKKLAQGDVIILDVNKARLQLLNIQQDVSLNKNEIDLNNTRLTELNGGNALLVTDTTYPATAALPSFEILDSLIEANDPVLNIYRQEIELARKQAGVQKALNLPKIEMGYHSQAILGQSYRGAHAGLSIPLWENKNKLRAAEAEIVYANSNAERHLLEHRLENKRYFDQLQIRMQAMGEYRSLISTLNNPTLLNKALQLGQVTVIQYFEDEAYYFSAYDKFLQMELEYQQALANLYKFTL